MRDYDRLIVAAHLEMAVRAAHGGDGAALAGAVMSIPAEYRDEVNEAIEAMCDTSQPFGALMHAATTSRS